MFIAECKVWGGPAVLTEAIDQLFRYVSWRDTKTAIVLFNRNRDFGAVLAKIPDTVKAHLRFIEQTAHADESSWRFIFRHPDDAERRVHVAVLAFEVPPAP